MDFGWTEQNKNVEYRESARALRAMRPTFYEFFAGGGMARAGLGPDWDCLFANDIDSRKADAYKANWGDAEFRLGDFEGMRSARPRRSRLGVLPLPGPLARGKWARPRR